ncbi:MAG: hypothetical protein V2I33_17210 [Kangiellaceae bacterium]|jgi:hypothetical protein|nr:hypothetical protein [Kangiellaceae bacterium]
MNKEFLASTSVFAEMANNRVDLQKIINEFIISTYILNDTYSQDSSQIRSELVRHFDIDIPEAIIRTQLKKLIKENALTKTGGQFVINAAERNARSYMTDDLDEKKELQSKIVTNLIDYVKFNKDPLNEKEKVKLENSFIEYLFDNSKEDEYTALISAFIVKNENHSDFLKELNLIREGATILKGLHYSNDFNDNRIWRNKLTIFLDTEHLLSLSGLNGETFKDMLMDFYNLVREINSKVQAKDGKIIQLEYTKNAKREIENLFYVAKLIVNGEATLQPGKTAIKNIVEGCKESTDITKKVSKFFASLKNMGVHEAKEIELFESPEFNVVDEKAITKYSDEKSEEDINRILEEFTYVNILRRGINNRGFDSIGFIIMTGDRVTRMMSYDNELKIENSDFSFATDVYYVTQRLWFRLNKGLGFSASLPSTLNVVNKARVIISSQINSSVRLRYNKLEKEVDSGTRTPEELQEYYLRLRSNTFSPENITSENLEDHITFIYSNDDLETYLRNRSAEKSALKDRIEKVSALQEENRQKEIENMAIKESLIKNSEKQAKKLYKLYKIGAILTIVAIVLIIALIGYILKQESDSILSVVAYLFSGVSILISLLSWTKISNWMKNKAYKEHNELLEEYN